MPPIRPADGRNPVKTRLDAKDAKKNVALAKVAQQAAWKKRMMKDGPKIDRRLADLTRKAKEIGELMKRKEDVKKALEDFADILQGTLKEMKTFTEVPVPGKLPDPPKNTIAMGTLLPVLMAMVAWWKLAKRAK